MSPSPLGSIIPCLYKGSISGINCKNGTVQILHVCTSGGWVGQALWSRVFVGGQFFGPTGHMAILFFVWPQRMEENCMSTCANRKDSSRRQFSFEACFLLQQNKLSLLLQSDLHQSNLHVSLS